MGAGDERKPRISFRLRRDNGTYIRMMTTMHMMTNPFNAYINGMYINHHWSRLQEQIEGRKRDDLID